MEGMKQEKGVVKMCDLHSLCETEAATGLRRGRPEEQQSESEI